MAEYYFNYEMRELKNELNISEENKPKLYFEQDYVRRNPPYYDMYLVIPQWCKSDGEDDDGGISSCTLSYDFNGTNMDAIDEAEKNLKEWNEKNPYAIDELDPDKKKGVEMISVKITRENYIHNTLNNNITANEPAYYRFSIVPRNSVSDFSGVGKLCLYGRHSEETIYLISVNFSFKKKITYEIRDKKIYIQASDVNLEKPPYINIASEQSDRYPCLVRDIDLDRKRKIKFDKKGRHVIRLENDGKVYLSLSRHTYPDGEVTDFNKFFYLSCQGNTTVLKKHDRYPLNPDIKFCPYCHRLIAEDFKYRDGGVSCSGIVHDKIKLIDNKGTAKGLAQKRIYCEGDLMATGDKLNTNFRRLLPDDFMESEHYKIIVVGSKRCGKTVFLSRLFGVFNPEKTEKSVITMDSRALRSALNRCGADKKISLENYAIPAVDSIPDDPNYYCGDNNWINVSNSTGQTYFNKYVINIAKTDYFPKATETAGAKDEEDTSRFPFILKLTGTGDGKTKYIYFYDIAGEDAQSKTSIMKNLIGAADDNGEGPRVGILYLVNGDTDSTSNQKVADNLLVALPKGKLPNYPIAVLLTKFDKIECEFETGCQCLRSDVYSMVNLKNFEESELALNIDLASEEVRTYLTDERMEPGFNKAEGDKLNVKYFGVSSFAHGECLYHEDQTSEESEEKNYLKFTSTTKRIEVPVIWMFRQLGII